MKYEKQEFTKEYSEFANRKLSIMTPGPTQVAANVYQARSYPTTNPDLDPDFFTFYKETCELFGELIGTKESTYLLGGEGILGLEAACASLTEPGDRVLVIDNGVFGKGFADFVSMYQGEPVLFSTDYHRPVDVEELEAFLKKDHNFTYATIVHSDTPSGVLNPVDQICPLLKSYGILTVVDSVTGMFAEPLTIDEAKIDVVCGGSQKVLSAPPGLTMVSVSRDAKKAMHQRKTPIRSFYANLLTMEDYYEKQWFPYTMPISDIYGLRVALENAKADTTREQRHRELAKAVRDTLVAGGIELYLEDGFANTVTAFRVPEGLTDTEILDTVKEQSQIMLAGSFGELAGKVIRIGHMGNNANSTDLLRVMEALDLALQTLGFTPKTNMKDYFQNCITLL